MPSIVIIGAGGHAKVLLDLVRCKGFFSVAGVVDPKAPSGPGWDGIVYLGDDSVLSDLRHRGISHAAVALGDNRLREKIGDRVLEAGFELPVLTASSAYVSPDAFLGAGTVVMAGAVIQPGVIAGPHCVFNTNCSVDHDCRLGTAVHVAPGCALAGGVTLGHRVFLGVRSGALPGVTIGDDAIVGGGAMVTKSLAGGQTYVGCPAKRIQRSSMI